MKIGILTFNPRSYSIRRLRRTALNRGHEVQILHAPEISLAVEHKIGARIFYRGNLLTGIDAVIPRISAAGSNFVLALVRQFEDQGILTLNNTLAIAGARDKLKTMQVLAHAGIPIPASAFVLSDSEISVAVEHVGGAPVVIKLVQGSQGIGVMLAETGKSAEAIIEALHVAQKNVLIQKFLPECRGKDVRAFVVGDKIVAAMRRIAQNNEFRSNVHRGGTAEVVELDADYKSVALNAAKLLGLEIAGVDILESNSGPLVMEVNASPGLEGIEQTTHVDVAKAIIELVEDRLASRKK